MRSACTDVRTRCRICPTSEGWWAGGGHAWHLVGLLARLTALSDERHQYIPHTHSPIGQSYVSKPPVRPESHRLSLSAHLCVALRARHLGHLGVVSVRYVSRKRGPWEYVGGGRADLRFLPEEARRVSEWVRNPHVGSFASIGCRSICSRFAQVTSPCGQSRERRLGSVVLRTETLAEGRSEDTAELVLKLDLRSRSSEGRSPEECVCVCPASIIRMRPRPCASGAPWRRHRRREASRHSVFARRGLRLRGASPRVGGGAVRAKVCLAPLARGAHPRGFERQGLRPKRCARARPRVGAWSRARPRLAPQRQWSCDAPSAETSAYLLLHCVEALGGPQAAQDRAGGQVGGTA